MGIAIFVEACYSLYIRFLKKTYVIGRRKGESMNDLSRYEQETIICYNEEEETANVYTHNNKLAVKLKRLAEKYPDKVKQDRREHRGAVSYTVPKRCVSVREPYSDARREADRQRALSAQIKPPGRGIRSKSE